MITSRGNTSAQGALDELKGHQISSTRTIIGDDEALAGNGLRAYTFPGYLERRQNALADQKRHLIVKR